MTIEDLNGKSVCILGYGVEGQASERAVSQYAPKATVTIRDQKDGSDYLENLEQFDVIIKSPGIPPLPELDPVQDKVTNSTQIFLETATAKGSTVIGITGSKGKSTTASLITAIFREAGKDVHLVGNIGIPTLDFVSNAKPGTVFVQEMSSYQLMDLTISPHIAVVTAFFPDHLDYHGSLEAYKAAKMHITKFQTDTDFVFFDASSDSAREIAEAGNGTEVFCNLEDSVVRVDETKLIGLHNQRNCAIASMVAEHFGIDRPTIHAALTTFEGLPHRLQSLGVHHEIEWVDDAISTTPESTIAGIDALGERVQTIILGGQDRGYSFDELAERVRRSNISTVILFPESGLRIQEALEKAGSEAKRVHADSMKQAVELAEDSTKPGRICLLSTASPSYNMFRNFEEKGDAFHREIEASC